jgi:hypothetical protein
MGAKSWWKRGEIRRLILRTRPPPHLSRHRNQGNRYLLPGQMAVSESNANDATMTILP